jgi:hypothetical protein
MKSVLSYSICAHLLFLTGTKAQWRRLWCMERVPLDVPNGGRRSEYNDINDHDVIMSEIPWLWAVVDGSTLPYGSQILIPT